MILRYPDCDQRVTKNKVVCFMDTTRDVTLVIPDQNMSDQTIFEIIFGLRIPNNAPAAGQCPSLGVLWSEIRE